MRIAKHIDALMHQYSGKKQLSFQSRTFSIFVGFSQSKRLGNWLILELWICALNELAERSVCRILCNRGLGYR
ncbi:hypothetical protein XFF6990_40025 [Xanthomonas citri pv. fuscans]|nr:hypothetical protein XFF6990_40025 [Xanthomonas citri pv. fuscans]